MIIPHVYFSTIDAEYKDYTLYTLRDCSSASHYKYFVDGIIYRKLREDLYSDKSIKIPEGSDIYLFPNCPIAVDDVRKHYKLHRGIDSADYNVYVRPNNLVWKAQIRLESALVFPEKKIIVEVPNRSHTKQEAIRAAKVLAYGQTIIDTDNCTWLDYTKKLYPILDVNGIYEKILNDTLTKPLVALSGLCIDSDLELNTDILQLVYTTGKASPNDNSRNDFIVQLNVLNQHNWRQYPGTIAVLFGTLFGYSRYHSTIYSGMIRTRSKYSKVVQTLLSTTRISSFASEKDFNLGQKFIMDLLMFDGTKFCSFSNLRDKIEMSGIMPEMFELLFNPVVRITPKNFTAANETKD